MAQCSYNPPIRPTIDNEYVKQPEIILKPGQTNKDSDISGNGTIPCPCPHRISDLYRRFMNRISIKTVIMDFGSVAANTTNTTVNFGGNFTDFNNDSVPTGKKWIVLGGIPPSRDVNANSFEVTYFIRFNNLPAINSVFQFAPGSSYRFFKFPMPIETSEPFRGICTNSSDIAVQLRFTFMVLEVPSNMLTEDGAWEFIHELWKGF